MAEASHALQVLALRENGPSVAAALKDNTALQVLDLGQLRIQPPAPRTRLAVALKDTTAVQVLDLRENGISVAAAWTDATALQVLDLGPHRISAAGIKDVVEASNALQVLDLGAEPHFSRRCQGPRGGLH